MKKKGISSLKIAGVYIGTVVGAGFATGQEVLQFFAAFGVGGLLGIVLSTALFILFGVIIMELGNTLRAGSHLEIVKQSGGRLFTAAMDGIITFFLFGALTSMLAGTGALFRQQFGLTGILGNAVMAVLAAMTVLTGIGGVINAISAVAPFLLASVIGISLFSIAHTPPDLTGAAVTVEAGLAGNWLLAAVLYASYNIVGAIAVLGPLGAEATNRRALLRGGVLGGLGLGLGALMIYFAVCGNLAEIQGLEVPMIHIAGRISGTAQLLYAVVLLAEVYTTAVGSLYGFAARLTEKAPGARKTVIIAASAAAFLASLMGFSNIVKYVYPLVGYAGIALLAGLLYGKMASRPRLHVLYVRSRGKVGKN